MLQELIADLTDAQRAQLRELGIHRINLSQWRTGKRLPTEVQAWALAKVTNTDRHALQDEIALARATPEQRTWLQEQRGNVSVGVLATLAGFGASVAALGAGNPLLSAIMRLMATINIM